MTIKEFDEEVKNFSPDKDDLKKKVDNLLKKGAGKVPIIHFIIEHKNCKLSEAMEIVESCPNYHKRFK